MGFAPRGQLYELFQIAPGDLVKSGSKYAFTPCKRRILLRASCPSPLRASLRLFRFAPCNTVARNACSRTRLSDNSTLLGFGWAVRSERRTLAQTPRRREGKAVMGIEAVPNPLQADTQHSALSTQHLHSRAVPFASQRLGDMFPTSPTDYIHVVVCASPVLTHAFPSPQPPAPS